MVRVIIAGLVGGVILFGWGCVSWLVWDVHRSTLRAMPNEDVVTSTLRNNIKESGLYWFPMMPADGDPEETEKWFERHREGATGMLLYQAEGVEVFTGTMLIRGFGFHLAAALLASWVVWLTRASANTVFLRLAVVMLLGLIVVTTTDLPLWNWMRYPTDYSMVNAAGHLIGILLMGIPIAFMVGEEKRN